MTISGLRIHVTGVVQGVGFRPFVYSLAQRLDLNGWVRNTSAGVDIELDGSREALDAFTRSLADDAPLLAKIDDIRATPIESSGFSEFKIVLSESVEGAFQPISPDVSICADCLNELNDPTDRRYRYPFINCTNCGPRFTIIENIPYDRPFTTMAPFEMCEECAEEYGDPLDRRFHAQPVACPKCGPHVWLEDVSTSSAPTLVRDEAVAETRRMLKDGKIVAIKGLGGFHLACDATNAAAVGRLRGRKLRVDKPFAVMMLDREDVKRSCLNNDDELQLLESHERPIVVLDRSKHSPIVPEVAPGQTTLGVMLPYTPLHYLLMEPADDFPEALVMTSGNLSEEPIATQNDEAKARLSGIADAFLFHDRGIRTRCDDSVMRVIKNDDDHQTFKHRGPVYPLRRSRGYAPYPIKLSFDTPPLLAAGAELKNAFCLTNERYAFISHHIGDMENYETLQAFEDGVEHLERLFRIKPEAIAYDLHPNYLASRYALERASKEDLTAIGVQHHHAHIVSCAVEHGLSEDRPVIGISFDGTGYGDDGAIWGGEVLISTFHGYERSHHLKYAPLPGGDKAIKEPWRMALSWLHQAGLALDDDLPPVEYIDRSAEGNTALSVLKNQIQSGVNAPPTSSMGRLFDAVAALSGVRQLVNYEAQAAIEFEALVDPYESGSYPLNLDGDLIDPTELFHRVIVDLRAGVGLPRISARFHNGIAIAVVGLCKAIRDEHQLPDVVLSGGVWQNMTLLHKTIMLLESSGFNCFVHHLVPANDGGLALGQAAIAAHQLR